MSTKYFAKTSEINTFNRVGIDYDNLKIQTGTETVSNWITGESFETHPLVAACVRWVYRTTESMESGSSRVNISDFDRVRYFILRADPAVYSGCID